VRFLFPILTPDRHHLPALLKVWYLFSAEKAVNERLTHTPELYLLALAQFAIAADTEVVSSFSHMTQRKWTMEG